MDTETEEKPEIIDLATMAGTPILKTDELLLSVPLTEEEWTGRVEQQDGRWATMRDLKEEEDARRKVFNTQHKAREAKFDEGQRIVAAKAEDRLVEVKSFAVLDSNLLISVRTDTGEVRGRRALKVSEIDKLSQQDLPLSGDDPGAEPVTIKGATFESPAAALAFVNDATVHELRDAGFGNREAMAVLDARPLTSLQALAEVPEPSPTPKGARDLVAFVKAGCADDRLDALDADNRPTVEAAVKARREALLARDMAEAEAGEPDQGAGQ